MVNALQERRISNLANISADAFLTEKHEPAHSSFSGSLCNFIECFPCLGVA
jgi:hypothetical protein